jgi:tetratricopeptide (TPR) repeat protein
MKKISFAISVLMVLTLAGRAQTDPMADQTTLINYKSLENKLKKSNEEILDVKKNTKAKTWLNRGNLMIDIYNVNIQYLRKGMTPNEAKIFFKEPKEIKASNGGEDHVYERIVLTYNNGALESWKETSKIFDNPLPEARKSLEEALKLDIDGKEKDDIVGAFSKLKVAFETEAVFAYNEKDHNRAYENFMQVLELDKLSIFEGVKDTIIMYNAGRAAFETENFKEASRLFNEVKNLGFDDPFLYIFIKSADFGAGDTLSGVEALREGYKRYPDNQTILIELINYYLIAQKTKEALDALAIARRDDPKNISYIFAEGTLRDKMGDFEEAKENYLLCLEIDPKFYNAAFNLGVLHYNKAVKMYEEMINITDNQEYEKQKTFADEMFKESIPYMEMAHQIDPNDKASLETLKTLYYRLQMLDKYEEVSAALKKLE